MITNYPVELLDFLKDKSIKSDEEVVGFIDDNFDFHECKNIHPDPENYFLIHPHESMHRFDQTLFHSHTKTSDIDGFSDWDKENQHYSSFKMLLYSVNKCKFYFME